MLAKPILTILGCHSSIPTKKFHPTSQILEIRGHIFLIDCGEGSQVQMNRVKIKFNKLCNIFISHLHGDHYFGLIGLLSTLQLLGREKYLNIYSPKGLQEIINIHLKWSESRLNYNINYYELNNNIFEKIFEDEKVEVYTFPLNHRIQTNGFLFKEKFVKKNLNINEIRKYPEIKISDYNSIKYGNDFITNDGIIISNNRLTIKNRDSISYAFCSDTAYNPSIINYINKVNLLYHESTFLNIEKNRAEFTKHSTAEQAAKIASKAKVGKLLLGHYSNRFKNINNFKIEAQKYFYNTELTEPLKKFIIE